MSGTYHDLAVRIAKNLAELTRTSADMKRAMEAMSEALALARAKTQGRRT